MKFRAIAVATERTESAGKAVGTVELEPTPSGLFVAYIGVGAFTQGYAPAAITSGTRVLVPWSAIDQAHFEGERLFLSFDPSLSPHHRLLLARFSSGAEIHHHELYRRRLIVRVAGAAAASIAALLALATVAKLAPERGPALAVAVAALSAIVMLVLAFFADRLLLLGGEETEAARLGLARELRSHLPALIHLPEPPPPARGPRTLADFQGLLPRTTFAIVVTLTATGLGTVLMARYLIKNEPERVIAARSPAPKSTGADDAEESERAPAKAAAAPAAPAPRRPTKTAASSAPSDGATPGEACLCQHPHSPLWEEPLPRLSILLLSQKVRQGRGEDESRRKKYTELDVAVVNNSSQPIPEVSLLVLFYAKEEGKARELVSNRPLFFAGPLLPAQAIKWSVEAEGTEFEIENPILGTVGDEGEDAAPADRVAELLDANHRPVRMHGALLLTFLGDPRAKEAIVRLREAMREDEAPYLMRLLDAARELRVCRLKVDAAGSKASGCVQNVSKEPRKDLGIKIRALAAAPRHEYPTAEPPTLLGESILALPGELAPGTGVAFSGKLTPSNGAPGAYEAVADRIDLLR